MLPMVGGESLFCVMTVTRLNPLDPPLEKGEDIDNSQGSRETDSGFGMIALLEA